MILYGGAVLCIAGCLAASLASTYWMLRAPASYPPTPAAMTTQDVSRHYRMFWGGKISTMLPLVENHWFYIIGEGCIFKISMSLTLSLVHPEDEVRSSPPQPLVVFFSGILTKE